VLILYSFFNKNNVEKAGEFTLGLLPAQA